jgi:hypothetical protein
MTFPSERSACHTDDETWAASEHFAYEQDMENVGGHICILWLEHRKCIECEALITRGIQGCPYDFDEGHNP